MTTIELLILAKKIFFYKKLFNCSKSRFLHGCTMQERSIFRFREFKW
jgi:hypothetical protein